MENRNGLIMPMASPRGRCDDSPGCMRCVYRTLVFPVLLPKDIGSQILLHQDPFVAFFRYIPVTDVGMIRNRRTNLSTQSQSFSLRVSWYYKELAQGKKIMRLNSTRSTAWASNKRLIRYLPSKKRDACPYTVHSSQSERTWDSYYINRFPTFIR